MAALVRGPLPARVYWRRRAAVLGTAGLLVLAVTQGISGADDASPGDASLRAVPAAGEPDGEGPGTTGGAASRADAETRERRAARQAEREAERKADRKAEKKPVLAEPEGDCVDRDVAVTPAVDGAVAGRAVALTLELRTITSPACTWRVSPETLTVKVTSGKDDIWSTRECPGAVPNRSVVVRSEASTTITVRWSGRRSDAECTRFTEWALPGWYHVAAAALAGEPSDVQFQLARPEPEVVTEPAEDRQRRDRPKPRDKHVGGPGQR